MVSYLELIISEPFDFKTHSGDNYLIVEVVEYTKDGIVCKNVSECDNITEYLYLTPRNADGHYNIYKMKHCNKINAEELSFAMIGSLRK